MTNKELREKLLFVLQDRYYTRKEDAEILINVFLSLVAGAVPKPKQAHSLWCALNKKRKFDRAECDCKVGPYNALLSDIQKLLKGE